MTYVVTVEFDNTEEDAETLVSKSIEAMKAYLQSLGHPDALVYAAITRIGEKTDDIINRDSAVIHKQKGV